MNGVARSARLFRAFRSEQADPATAYELLAVDTVEQLHRLTGRSDLRVLDVGGGPGYLAEALAAAGATCVTADPEWSELHLHGRTPRSAAVADGRNLCFPDESFDVVHSSNVLEHVEDPWHLLEEMVRVTRPGGLLLVFFTNWWSPHGGHETAPWHYLGGRRAARRYERHHGSPPKNRFGESLFPLHVGEALEWAKAHPDVELVDAFPRYYPRWAKPVVAIPGLREVLTWNLAMVLRRRW